MDLGVMISDKPFPTAVSAFAMCANAYERFTATVPRWTCNNLPEVDSMLLSRSQLNKPQNTHETYPTDHCG